MHFCSICENMYYIPRTLNNYDPVYGADDSSSYDNAIPIEIYIKSINTHTHTKHAHTHTHHTYTFVRGANSPSTNIRCCSFPG